MKKCAIPLKIKLLIRLFLPIGKGRMGITKSTFAAQETGEKNTTNAA
ncbi:hypothetical protein [Parageobacillus thermoglucosidasius]|uniref:Uncharacterized protein n=1 Tax=Parageobacillus thermoglucosidasius TaxID=1426 RepID=A0AB38QVD1_PARTM|nr:hypothetical protein [Parageobacillus thermoglucosidasius]UOE75060.1 hypothetical protein IMI45_11955 [Parageobacillus thermoglucosidasius]